MVRDIHKEEWAKATTAAEKLALAEKLVEEVERPRAMPWGVLAAESRRLDCSYPR